MTTTAAHAAHLKRLLAEIARRSRLRQLVAKAGYTADSAKWVRCTDVTEAVAKLLNLSPNSMSLRLDLRRFLLAEEWVLRRTNSGWQWRARKVKGRG